MNIAQQLTINASFLPDGFTIAANGQSRILEIRPRSTVLLQDPYG